MQASLFHLFHGRYPVIQAFFSGKFLIKSRIGVDREFQERKCRVTLEITRNRRLKALKRFIMSNDDYGFDDGNQSYMTVNELLQVKITEDHNSATYFSRINDISEGKLVIAWPTNGGIRLLVHRDQILDFSFMREGVPYSFTGLVDETSIEPLPQITTIISSAVMRVQRRQNFRIKCLIPIEIVGSFKEHPDDDCLSSLDIQTTTYDLSASGVAVRYAKRIPEGTLLDVKLSLPDDGPVIKAPCRVVYSDEFAVHSRMYRTGMQYLAINEWERARIVRFVYRTQLKSLNQ
jgi:c-di-GMP-binding flagellar brake protein YcgR